MKPEIVFGLEGAAWPALLLNANCVVLRSNTAATDMLCQGASLKEIADVLGHRSIETTTIYAKVDLPGLNTVTMPWPEVEP